MQRRRLGTLEVSAVGLGCATMTPFYDEPDEEAAIDTLRRSREIGIDFLPSTSLRKLAYHSVNSRVSGSPGRHLGHWPCMSACAGVTKRPESRTLTFATRY